MKRYMSTKITDPQRGLTIEGNSDLTELNELAAQGWKVVVIVNVGSTVWAILEQDVA